MIINAENSGLVFKNDRKDNDKQSLIDKITKRINIHSSGCWEWQGAKNQKGYGRVYHNGKYLTAHRAVLQMILNFSLSKEIFACHKCDNPSCCNPKHLFMGTVQENTADMMRKNRHWKHKSPEIIESICKKMSGRRESVTGENHPRAKLCDEDVLLIREMNKQGGFSYPELARRFGVNPTAIQKIITRQNWRHI